jgi:hypothetical protein
VDNIPGGDTRTFRNLPKKQGRAAAASERSTALPGSHFTNLVSERRLEYAPDSVISRAFSRKTGVHFFASAL